MEIEKLGFKEEYKLVYADDTKEIYAHTTYHEVEIEQEDYITEDDTPVDNIFSEKEQRLLIDPLHNNPWTDRDFLASSNVGIYYAKGEQLIVPDMLLSFDVKAPEDWLEKQNRCYHLITFGKAPELVVEVISNKEGGEADRKMRIYAQIGIFYYILIDPYLQLYPQKLNVFRLNAARKYEALDDSNFYMPEIQLGIFLWEGLFEKYPAQWARWCDKDGNVLKTGTEKNSELNEKNSELNEKNTTLSQKLEDERKEKEEALQRAEKLEALLKELGLKPD
ncbi:MAG: Uma2 family endonuclease [Microscillaceae bacterium]|nr:Uma2 family endonuclease [Microscillaceae bacterium]